MNKREFLEELQKRLAGLPQSDIEQTIDFYEEMIEERLEEGKSEEEAIAEIGSIEDIVSQIILDTPLPKLVKERMKPKRALRVWEIVLLALGSPIWISLGIATFAVAAELRRKLRPWRQLRALAGLPGCQGRRRGLLR